MIEKGIILFVMTDNLSPFKKFLDSEVVKLPCFLLELLLSYLSWLDLSVFLNSYLHLV